MQYFVAMGLAVIVPNARTHRNLCRISSLLAWDSMDVEAAGHSIECITHAVRRRHSAATRHRTAVSSRLFALFDPVTLTFDLLT